jgi:putative FmdB family regulatory protein
MPLYEYQCEAGHRFELIRKFSDPPLDACPTCGAAVHKLVSSPAFQFKGTGWYITDYAKKDGGSSSSGGEGKTDSSAKDQSTSEKADKTAGKSEKAAKTDKVEKSDAKAETKASGDSASSTPSAKNST